jgi:hypothetical protein
VTGDVTAALKSRILTPLENQFASNTVKIANVVRWLEVRQVVVEVSANLAFTELEFCSNVVAQKGFAHWKSLGESPGTVKTQRNQ